MSPRMRFDFADASGTSAPVAFDNPSHTIVAHRIDDVRPALRAVERALADGWYAAGFVAYEAAPAFDTALAAMPASEVPLVWFGLFDGPAPATTLPQASGGGIAQSRDQPDAASAMLEPAEWTPDISASEYRRGVEAVRDAIVRGDVYQTNYTFRLTATLDPAAIEARYLRLAAEHRAPYSVYADIGSWRILSLSPELFFRVHDGHVTTTPMKGTAARGFWPEQDVGRSEGLSASEKERAENLMIVDLARNDIGRIAQVGSVRVPSLFAVEKYPTVFQMVSTVEGRLRSDVMLGDIFAALFPAGSITGAPKTSSTRLITRIEGTPRGVYCGAIGFATPAGDAVFNVAIRTAVTDIRTGSTTFGIGGGITWDSTPENEYAEATTKAACLSMQPSFELIETIRWESGAYVRMDRHLKRLGDSAAFLEFTCEMDRIAAELAAHALPYSGQTRRVRLRLSRNGRVDIESRAPDPPPDSPPRVALADTPIDRNNRFLYHKTTERDVYRHHTNAHPDAFDVLLWNDVRELTEFTIGNLVVEIAGIRWTPARASGLLAGVFRAALLDAGEIRERVLTTDDLHSITRLWLINSLRGWVEVRL